MVFVCCLFSVIVLSAVEGRVYLYVCMQHREITFSVSAVWVSFVSRQIVLLRELLLGRQLHLSLLLYSFSLPPSLSLSTSLIPRVYSA